MQEEIAEAMKDCPNCGKPVDDENMEDHMASCKAKEETQENTEDLEEKKLTSKERNALSDSQFALPGGRYPIPDESHARNALARAAQQYKAGNLSAGEYATIKRKVKAKFPDIQVSEEEDIEFIDAEAEVVTVGESQEHRFVEDIQILEATPAGTDWRVVMISPGVSKNRTYYSPSMLSKKVGLFEGALAFSDHNPDNPTNRSIKEVVGWYDSAKYEPGVGITATFHALESRPWFTDMLREAYSRGKPDLFGFSINGVGSKRVGKVNGENVFVVEDLHKIDSVDAVINPSAGGRLLRLVAGMNSDKEELDLIDKMSLEELKTARPDLYEEIVTAAVSESEAKLKEAEAEAERLREEAQKAEVNNNVENVTETTTQVEDTNKKVEETAARFEEQMQAQLDKIAEMTAKAEQQARIAECKVVLAEKLASSELPEPVRKKIEKKYAGQVFEADRLEEDINEEKEIISALLANSPYNRVADPSRVSVGDNHQDRAIKALDGFWTNKAIDGVAPARGLMEAYSIWTGKNSWDLTPTMFIKESRQAYDSENRVSEALSGAVGTVSGTAPGNWAEILGDSITRRMVAEYNDLGYDEWRQICNVESLSDFRTQRRTRFGGYSLLSVVAEAGTYNAMTSPTDQEATYVPAKRGGTETITMEMIARDDLQALRRIPFKLARAAKITLYRFVFDMLSLSAAAGSATVTYDASASLFTTGKANTVGVSQGGSDATLNDANLTTAKQKMAKQAAYNESTHILGLKPRFMLIPVELQATALRLQGQEFLYAGPTSPSSQSNSQTDINVHRGSFEIITLPYWGDDADGRSDRWVLVADPADVPTIEIGFFQGKEMPELFTQDMETVGSMFNTDQLTYKLRHIYGGTVLDHRGMVASATFGLV